MPLRRIAGGVGLTGARIDSSVEFVPSRVVCISSFDGAGGEEVGRLVAERLSVRLVDEEIIRRAAREAGVDSHVVADAEQRKSLVARVLKDVLAGSAAAAPTLGLPAGSQDALYESDDFRGLIRTAVESRRDCSGERLRHRRARGLSCSLRTSWRAASARDRVAGYPQRPRRTRERR